MADLALRGIHKRFGGDFCDCEHPFLPGVNTPLSPLRQARQFTA